MVSRAARAGGECGAYVARGAHTRFLVPAAATVLLCGVLAAPAAADPGTVQPLDAPVTGRILFAGTQHRSLGVVTAPVPGRPVPTQPLLGGGPTHFDDQPAARGDHIVFTSRRDEPTPQVYLRNDAGTVRQLTTGRNVGHPELSPDRSLVVFDSAEPGGGSAVTRAATQRDLWVVGTDGQGLRRLTDTPGDEESPTFSPDGTRIAFASNRDGTWQIYQQPLDGGEPVRLTDEPAGVAALEPAWNPVDDPAHRDRIAYTVDLGAGNTPRRSLRLADADRLDVPILGGDQATWESFEPAWKPDGNGLLFLSPNQPCGCTPDNTTRVYQVDTGPGVPVAATPDLLLDENRLVGSPTWLTGPPGDGLVVARTTAADPHTATLQDIRPDGADPRDLGLAVLREDPAADTDADRLFSPGAGFDPWSERQNYSPDGQLIAVSRFEDDPTTSGRRIERIWLVDADGTNPRTLPVADRSPADWETDATWSPDGRFIAFARQSPGGLAGQGGPSRIVVVEVATGAVVGRLQPPPDQPGLDDAQPVWSPDGTTIAFTRVMDINGSRANKHIWTARAGTLDQQRDVTAAACGSDCAVIDDSPAFTPDGRSVAFNRKDDAVVFVTLSDNTCRVVLPVGQATSCGTPIAAPGGPFQPRDVAFSPEGGRMVLSTRRDAPSPSPEALAIVDLATGALTPLDWDLPGRQKEPSWQQTVDLAVTAPPTTAPVPVGGQVTVTVTVTNHGPSPAPGTTLSVSVPAGIQIAALRPDRGTCDAAQFRCDLGLLEPGAAVNVTADLTGIAPGSDPVHWSVAGTVLDQVPADNTADTVVPVRGQGTTPPPTSGPPTTQPPPTTTPPTTTPPKPPPTVPPGPPALAEPGLTVAVRPSPAFVGGRVAIDYTVRNNSRAVTATGLSLTLGLPGGVPVATVPTGCTPQECTVDDLPPGGSRVLRMVLAPRAPLRTIVRGTLRTTGTDANPANNIATAALPILQPRIIAVPAVGKPGFVTLVRGIDFPAGVPVRLTWSPGITVPAVPIHPRRDGRFTAQLLILVKDETGPRTITATGPGFSPVTTPFLVVAGTIGPPDLVARR